MEDIAADDDLLSDMLLDSLEFEPPISTHKMNQAYRSPRFDTQAVIDLVRRRVVIERDIPKALEELCGMSVVRKHLQRKTPRQTQAFQTHARRYFEAYLPDSGFEFSLTNRYQRSLAPLASSLLDASSIAESSAAGAAAAAAEAASQGNTAAPSRPASLSKTKGRRSGELHGQGGHSQSGSKADLCVVAVKKFKPGDLIPCKGGVKDLTKAEDEALRNEAAASRESKPKQPYSGVLGQGRDFSIIKSSMRNCSQLLLGPARFVNHDCEPSVQFYRNGQQMMFKVLKPIQVNEEVLVGYGEHYFGWQNCECLCATCESKASGAFAREGVETLEQKEAAEEERSKASPAETSTEMKRTPSQRLRERKVSPRTTPTHAGPTSSATPTRLDLALGSGEEYANRRSNSHSSIGIRNSVVPSDRELIDPAQARGPKCQCLTCGCPFYAPETWWLPDECRRCERHYRIYKADWPHRIPTEGAFAALSQQFAAKQSVGSSAAGGNGTPSSSELAAPSGDKAKTKKHGHEKGDTTRADAGKSRHNARKIVHSPPPESTASLSSNASVSQNGTPIRLSPLRTIEIAKESDQTPRPVGQQAMKRSTSSKTLAKRSAEGALARGDADDSQKETRNSSQKAHRPPPSESGSELTEQSTDHDNARNSGAMSRSDSSSSSASDTPSGPKMLGKSAKTETLAMYWGAEEGGKRVRKASSNGPVSLAAKAALQGHEKKRGKNGHRRTASATRRPSVFEPDSEEDESYRTASPADKKGLLANEPKIVPSPPLATDASSANGPSQARSAHIDATNGGNVAMPRTSGRPVVEREQPASIPGIADVPSPAASVPQLATHGTERTSIKNLAAFWSAGVDSGSRTRRQANRDPLLLSAQNHLRERGSNSPKRSRRQSTDSLPSSVGDSSVGHGSKKARVRKSMGRASESGTPVAQANSEAASSRRASLSEKPALEQAPMDMDEGVASQSSTAVHTTQPQQTENLQPLLVSPLEPTLADDAAPSSASLAPALVPVLPDSPAWPGVVPRGTNDTSVPAAAASPLGGPPASYQVIPGRKNLRIGRPSSMSRPMSAGAPSAPPPAPSKSSPHAASASPAPLPHLPTSNLGQRSISGPVNISQMACPRPAIKADPAAVVSAHSFGNTASNGRDGDAVTPLNVKQEVEGVVAIPSCGEAPQSVSSHDDRPVTAPLADVAGGSADIKTEERSSVLSALPSTNGHDVLQRG
ncbi:unnamed protein product [Parajaminaea phylloscopi]